MKAKRTDREEFERFVSVTDALLSVPHAKVQKLVEKHRRKAAKNPSKPGPKPKAK